MNWPLIISGLAVGMIFGFVLQHGRFCMNTAFREVLLSRDFTVFRAYLLALLILIVGANLMEVTGIIHLRKIPFNWLANMVGGYIFGIGMVIGGGCASGTLYRIGEGMIGSWLAALGFMLTTAAMLGGVLQPLTVFMQNGTENFPLVYNLPDDQAVTIYNLIGIDRWVLIAIIAVPVLIFIGRGKFKKPATQKGFIWWSTGIMIGLIGVIAFYASEVWGGLPNARGLSFTGPLNEIIAWFTSSSTAGSFKQIATENQVEIGNLSNAGTMTWSIWMIFGVVLGSLLSAIRSKEFGWRSPKAQTLATQFGGGLIMGIGGSIAGGCNVGHGLTGLATLSIGSLVGIISIVLGCWTMVYFLFIRE